MRTCLALVAIAATATDAAAECPGDFELVRIADDTGELTLTDPATFTGYVLPSINTPGNVAFAAFLDAGGQLLLVGDENNLTERLRDRGADPASDWVQLGAPVLGATDRIAFRGQLDSGQAVAQVLNSGELAVLSDTFLGPGEPDIATAGVAFTAAVAPGESVIVAVPEATPLIEDEGEPGGYADVSYAGRDNFLFWTSVPGQGGLVIKTSEGAEVAATDLATGLGPTGVATRGFRGGVAYLASVPSQTNPGFVDLQVRRWSGATQASTVLADSAVDGFSQIADTIMFASIMDRSPEATDGAPDYNRCVGFIAQGREGRDTIFVADDDGVTAVVEEGDPAPGGDPIATIAMRAQGVNSRGQMAFWLETNDGTQMIVRADPAGLGDIDPDDPDDPIDPNDDGDQACGCSSGGSPSSAALIALVVLLGCSRRPPLTAASPGPRGSAPGSW